MPSPLPSRMFTVPVRADDGQVDLAVAVEVARLGVDRIGPGGVIDLRLERAVAVAEHDAHGARDGAIDDGHVGLAVAVVVGDRDVVRIEPSRKTDGRKNVIIFRPSSDSNRGWKSLRRLS